VVGDARRQIRRSAPETFDVVVLDAFAGGVFPYHLGSVECFREIRRVLKDEGVLCVNLLAAPSGSPGGEYWKNVASAAQSVFPHMSMHPATAETRTNIFLYASAFPIRFKSAPVPEWRLETMKNLIERVMIPNQISASALAGFAGMTDDRNGLDLMGSLFAHAGRTAVRDAARRNYGKDA